MQADSLPTELSGKHYGIGGRWYKTIPKKKKYKKAKWFSEEALQIAEKKREAKGKGDKKIYPSECRVPKNSKER